VDQNRERTESGVGTLIAASMTLLFDVSKSSTLYILRCGSAVLPSISSTAYTITITRMDVLLVHYTALGSCLKTVSALPAAQNIPRSEQNNDTLGPRRADLPFHWSLLQCTCRMLTSRFSLRQIVVASRAHCHEIRRDDNVETRRDEVVLSAPLSAFQIQRRRKCLLLYFSWLRTLLAILTLFMKINSP
jgi:hypothetical protein